MKRALALLAVLFIFGCAGFANQITGEWETTIRFLPSQALRSSVLTLNYAWDVWTVTSIATFGDTDMSDTDIDLGFTTLEFDFSGSLGPVTLSGGMTFNAGVTKWECEYCETATSTSYTTVVYTGNPPEYMNGFVSAELEFGGVTLTGEIDHWVYPYYDGWGCWPCEQTESYMIYSFTAATDTFKARVRFDDCCEGIEFKDFYAWWYDLSLCCGVTFDITAKFTKAGFSWVDIYFTDLFPLCCGISFDFEVFFTETSKSIYLYPTIGDLEGCVTVYLDVYPAEITPDTENPVISGLDIYGLEISCEFTECTSISFLTVFKVPPKSWCEYSSWYKDAKFTGYEFERAEFSFCGPACCGGEYSLNVVTYFATDGGLFDLSRLKGTIELPVMSNFTLEFGFTLPLDPDYGDFTLDFGWDFTF